MSILVEKQETPFDWSPEDMLEVKLKKDDSFLQVVETLTRIGIPNFGNKTLVQSCHILQKRQKYYIMNFKELLCLDGEQPDITEEDIERRNRVARLLEEWNLIEIVHPEYCAESNDPDKKKIKVFVLKHSNKSEWNLVANYTIGVKHE